LIAFILGYRGVPAGIFATGSGSGFFGPKSGFTGSRSGLLATPTKNPQMPICERKKCPESLVFCNNNLQSYAFVFFVMMSGE